MFENTNKLLDSFTESGIPFWDILVKKDGVDVFRRMYGVTDYEKKISINGKERYNLYSCSKPITCVAALQLVEKGVLSLEDDLALYIPEFAEMNIALENGEVRRAEKKIKIKHLFEMSAGFDYDLRSPSLMLAREETGGRMPTLEAIKYLARENLHFEPGTYFRYSLCHDVLAAVIEVASGKKFSEYVRENIFAPLSMKDSTFDPSKRDEDTLCAQYEYKEATRTVENCGKSCVYVLGSEYESGGAGLVSTLDDYMKFLEAVRKGDVILSNEMTDLMSTNRMTDEQLKDYWLPPYGYGLGVRCPKGNDSTTDFGWGGAASSYLAIDRINGISIFYAEHVLSDPNGPQRDRLIDAVKADLLK